MSRWQDAFEQHSFQAEWSDLIGEVSSLTVDDETVFTTVEELARLKKLLVYINQIINAIDVELTPQSTWENFAAQISPCLQQVKDYRSNRNVSHLIGANKNADNLLSYVKPYMALPADVLTALDKAASSYRSSLESYANGFVETVNANVISVDSTTKEVAELLTATKAASDEIHGLKTILIDGSEVSKSVKEQIDQAQSAVIAQSSAIKEFHDTVFTATGETPSVQQSILEAKNQSISDKNLINEALQEVQDELTDLNAFHEKVYGKDGTGNKPTGGFVVDLDSRIAQLDTYEQDQEVRHDALFEKIESLLPGATSAGLALAYQDLRKGFEEPIENATRLFYFAVGTIPVMAIIASIHSLTLWPFSIAFEPIPDLEVMLKGMLYKSLFILPLIWLAFFASARRSQYERLKQEYAHKEAIAKSYESYSKQLKELIKEDSEPLQKELIQKAIEAIAFNASNTLDGPHREKLPMEQIIEVLASDNNQTLLDKLKKKIFG